MAIVLVMLRFSWSRTGRRLLLVLLGYGLLPTAQIMHHRPGSDKMCTHVKNSQALHFCQMSHNATSICDIRTS
jgi:hypothetical protein